MTRIMLCVLLICLREAIIHQENGVYHLFYDGATPEGWRVCLALSRDLVTWEKRGPLLELGTPGEMDSAAAISPWVKQKNLIPFSTCPNTYYSITASAGHVVKHNGEYLMFFSSTTKKPENPCVLRTLGIARTGDLDGKWAVDPGPIVPIEEQIENSSLYFEPTDRTWFLFTNHIGLDREEYTDAAWVYWSQDLNKWDARNKAVVLDCRNCTWSKKCIGMPSVIPAGKRLALFYDAPGGDSTSHLGRDIGLAWLDLPLTAPGNKTPEQKVGQL